MICRKTCLLVFLFVGCIIIWKPIYAQDRKVVTGTVTDATTNKGVENAEVYQLKSSNRALTDSLGNFADYFPLNSTLVISRIGYKNDTIVVKSDKLMIHLKHDTSLDNDEVVVVGFGTQKKKDVTGSVYQVNSKMLENRPVMNLGQALQGLVPNLNISNSNGSPNSTPSLNIRGGTSFSGNTISTGSPYTLVDGVEMDINSLNPEDIESVSVLSDAASSAIYGARAAFGVILVTTKKGVKNRPVRVTYSNSFQWSRPTEIPDLLSSTQIQQAVVDAYGIIGQSAPADALRLLDSVKGYASDPTNHQPYFMNGAQIIWNANVNPFKEAVSNNASIQKHNISLNGGNEKNSYYASIGYLDQDGLFKINTDKFKRYNFMLNTSSIVTNWFKVDFKSNYTRTTFSSPVNPSGKGGWWRAFAQEPGRNVFMPLKTPSDAPIPDAYTGNILSYMAYGSNDWQDNSILQLAVSPTITPVKNWNIRADIAYRAEFFNQKTVIPLLQKVETTWNRTDMTTDYTNPSSVYKDNNTTYHYTINAYTDYTLRLNDHHLYGLVGFNQELEKYLDLNATGNQLITSSVPVIDLTSGQKIPTDAESEWSTRGSFYRFTYDYKGKYLVQSNGRYDLSSRFPKDRRGKLFPGISLGWRISQEEFMASTQKVISDLKFRASYASLGNQEVANYIYIPTYGTTNQVNQIFNGARPIGITPPGLVDPNLTWETATTLDLGADLTLFKKLTTNFSWYRRRTTNILVAGSKYPAVIGATAPTQNSGILETKGFDLQTTWKDATSYGLNYSITFTLSNYSTQIVQFNGNPNKLLSSLYSGMHYGEIWGFVTDGIYQNQSEIDNGPIQSSVMSGKLFPGDVKYKDLNGNDSITYGASTVANPGDRKIIGNSTPKYAFSLNNFFSWKNFDLNIFLQGIGKRDYYISDNLFWGAISGGIGTQDVYNNSWTAQRTNAKYPAYRSGQTGNVLTQTRFLQNAAYLRLKNISLGYSFDREILKKVNLPFEKIRVSAMAYNLLTFSSLPKYFDPEVLSAAYPIQKNYAFSLLVNF